MSRVRNLALTLVCLLAASCAGKAPVPTAPPAVPTATVAKSGTIRFFDISNLDMRDIPMLMALDDLRAQGYVVEVTYLTKGSLIADALARGEADIALVNNQTMWNAIAKGADARTIVEPVAATTMLVAQKAITNCAQLDGLGVGKAEVTGLSPARLDLYFQQNCPGMVPKYVVITEPSGRAAGLISGELAASLMPAEQMLKLEEQAPGKLHVLADMMKEFPGIRQDGVHVRASWARENPHIVEDFLRALLLANRHVGADPDLLASEAVGRLSMEPATAQSVGGVYLAAGIYDANGGLTEANVQGTIDFLVGIQTLPEGLKAADVADLSYLNAVLDEIGRR